jgi:hypothetical protein
MKILKVLGKLITYLTKEKNAVIYDQSQLQIEVEKQSHHEEEESILETTIENPYVNQIREWAIKKIDLLHDEDSHCNAKALSAEFDEWINIPDNMGELNYLCIEDDSWSEDGEIDVI